MGNATKAADYEQATEFIINHLKEKIDHHSIDIATALENLEHIDFQAIAPKLQVETTGTDEEKARKNRQYEIDYEQDRKDHNRRTKNYDDNCATAYSILWARCHANLIEAIKNEVDFESKIKNDPVELLTTIKQHTHNFSSHKYAYITIHDANKAWTSCRQKDDETLTSYAKRFESSVELFQSRIGGPMWLPSCYGDLTTFNGLSEAKRKEKVDEKWEEHYSLVFLVNSDRKKYGSLIQLMSSQFSMGQDQYPKTFKAMKQALQNHQHDNRTEAKSESKKDKKEQKTETNRADKPSPEVSPDYSFAQLEGSCYVCGKPSHKAHKCHHRNKIPKDKWAVNIAAKNAKSSFLQSNDTSSPATTTESTTAAEENYTTPILFHGVHLPYINEGVQFLLAQGIDLRKAILVDTCSVENIFCNPDYLHDIRRVQQMLNLSTNGGPCCTDLQGIFPGIKDRVWFKHDSLTNILSFGVLAAHFRITYDNAKEDAFQIHTESGSLKVLRASNNLYYFVPSDRFVKYIAHLKTKTGETLPSPTDPAKFAGVQPLSAGGNGELG